MSEQRLQKILARAGVASRRSSEKLISDGRVSVNGVRVDQLGSKADPEHDVIALDGVPLTIAVPQVTIMLNKPCGYITAMSDDHGARCVSELVPCDEYPSLFPVGRLDKDTSGLLVFTTDGEWGNRLIHPRSHVAKRYLARVAEPPSPSALKALEEGIDLDDGMTAPAIACLSETDPCVVELTIFEGRKRQVRRMLDAIGHPVLALHRASIGGLELGDLDEGCYRELSSSEIAALERTS